MLLSLVSNLFLILINSKKGFSLLSFSSKMQSVLSNLIKDDQLIQILERIKSPILKAIKSMYSGSLRFVSLFEYFPARMSKLMRSETYYFINSTIKAFIFDAVILVSVQRFMNLETQLKFFMSSVKNQDWIYIFFCFSWCFMASFLVFRLLVILVARNNLFIRAN